MGKSNRSISIRGRLGQLSLVVILIFALIATTLYFSFRRVRTSVDHIVESTLETTTRHLQNSRDFGLLNARLSVFENNFSIDDTWYQVESKGLQEDIHKLQEAVSDTEMTTLLAALQEQFSVYLQRREWINYLLFWRSGEDEDIGELFLLLQEIVAEKMNQVIFDGGDADYLEQLILLISSCQEGVSKIAKINAEENPAYLLTASINTPAPLKAELSDLQLRLRSLSISEPPVDRLGKHLMDHFSYYQHQMQQYSSEMIRLGELSRGMNQLTGQILTSMEKLDQGTAARLHESKHEISETIITTASSVQFLLLLLAVSFWIVIRSLFKKHIQTPMGLVGERLQAFQQGDHSSLMQLGRNDEWADIEMGLNLMLADLEEGLSALQQSEQNYRDIFNNATDGIFQAEVSGKLSNANPALAEIFGYNFSDKAEIVAEMAGINIQRDIYFQAEDRDQWLNLIHQHGEVRDFEVRLLRRDGRVFWAAVNGHLVRDSDGQIVCIEGTVRDITTQKTAQESIHQLQTYLQNIIDSMPSVLIGVDINMEVTLWNKRAEQESILTAEEANGLSITQVCRLFNSTAYMPKLEETLKTRQPTRLLKVESLKKTQAGTSRFFDILIYPLSLTEASGAVIHMDDVTERLHLEEMMVRSEKMQSVGGLAAGLAHEINNPLAVILQNVQVMTRRLSPALDKNRQVAESLGTTIEIIGEYTRLRGCEKMLHSISDAGQRAAKIVENMQSFSRSGGSNFIPCCLSDLLEKMVELAGSDYEMRHQFNFKKIRIVREYQPSEDVCCEASQIQQVFLSLLKNAAQVLSLDVSDPQITLRIFPYGEKHIFLQVEDNGPGMDAAVATRIFDPFYTTREVGQGTGLGLSIAYFIVTHNHGGRLSVTSEPGQGSCFEMVLPLTDDEETFIF